MHTLQVTTHCLTYILWLYNIDGVCKKTNSTTLLLLYLLRSCRIVFVSFRLSSRSRDSVSARRRCNDEGDDRVTSAVQPVSLPLMLLLLLLPLTWWAASPDRNIDDGRSATVKISQWTSWIDLVRG